MGGLLAELVRFSRDMLHLTERDLTDGIIGWDAKCIDSDVPSGCGSRCRPGAAGFMGPSCGLPLPAYLSGADDRSRTGAANHTKGGAHRGHQPRCFGNRSCIQAQHTRMVTQLVNFVNPYGDGW